MRRPDRRPERPRDERDVIDLNARRRVNELKAQARKTGRPAPSRVDISHPLTAWALLLLAALLWALVRWLT